MCAVFAATGDVPFYQEAYPGALTIQVGMSIPSWDSPGLGCGPGEGLLLDKSVCSVCVSAGWCRGRRNEPGVEKVAIPLPYKRVGDD